MTRLIQGDCREEIDKLIARGVKVDLTVTSPPYDKLRTYKDTLEWNETVWKQVIDKLYLITKDGGVVVWVVGDETVKGSETGTSFKQALYFKEVGFNLHDTMIYSKTGMKNPSSNRYHQTFEYMFVFSKGKPNTFNPIKDRKNKYVGICGGEKSYRGEFGMRFNVWKYANGGNNTTSDKNAFKHPAIFPEKLAEDHILSWSNEGDTVFDPFMGSCTTGKMAKINKRNFIGIEKVPDYFKISQERLGENK